jgi:hypothetical protein
MKKRNVIKKKSKIFGNIINLIKAQNFIATQTVQRKSQFTN